MILAGDVGGTETLLALYAGSPHTLSPVREETYQSRDFSSLEDILLTFLARTLPVAFPPDHARSRAYRWGEDGLAGISDNHQRLCFALALGNGRDPILKERLFGAELRSDRDPGVRG